MPIVYTQLIPANAAAAGYAEAKELARQTVALYGAVRFAGAGIGAGSCCAAAAVAGPDGFAAALLAGFGPAPFVGGFPQPIYGAALPYGVVAGNSQLAGGGLAVGPLGGHAERAALTAAGNAVLALYHLPGTTNAVIFVELTPCAGCQTWLNGGGGGVANPFNGIINGGGGTTLNVWWRWTYPDGGGVVAMNAFHAMTLPAQLAQINGATW
jgi:hypothetical protein